MENGRSILLTVLDAKSSLWGIDRPYERESRSLLLLGREAHEEKAPRLPCVVQARGEVALLV